MISSFATSLILPPRDGRLAVAVLGAEPTATTYLIHGCRTEIVDLNECDGSTATMTVGPWARSSSSSEVAFTGVFDEFAVLEYEGKNYTHSEHCEMTGTVAKICTVIDELATEDGITETLSYESGKDNEEFTFTPYPVTITQGLDLLVAAESSSTKTTTAGTDDEATGATTSEQTFTRGSASETKTPGSAEEASVGASSIPCIIAAMAVAVVATAVLR